MMVSGGSESRPRFRARVSAKFFLVLAALIPCVVVVGWIGWHGQGELKLQASEFARGEFQELLVAQTLAQAVGEVGWTALQGLLTTAPDRAEVLREHLQEELIPQVDEELDALEGAITDDDRIVEDDDPTAADVSVTWEDLRTLLTSPEYEQALGDPAAAEALAQRIVDALSAAHAALDAQLGDVQDDTAEADDRLNATQRRTYRDIVLVTVVALVLGIGSVLWLIRDIVPRIRRYSQFASEVAAGDLSDRLGAAGSDELGDLARTLDTLVERRTAEQDYEQRQAEFSEALQVTESEDEAHQLLKRHLERSMPRSYALVMNRNNSANWLQPTTPMPEESPLVERLSGAQPRACLAVRYGRPHDETAGEESLTPCAVCCDTAPTSRCHPLLVGGEVIGSVLVQHEERSALDARRLNDSVVLAAPVLANLRNLALAEHRALTDALTGLPNQRASHDTLIRMAAQAARAVQPLAAVLLDLDHFKQVNDHFGHDKGDEVLAAVAAVLVSTVRTSDFAGRYGGEEFLLLLTGTGRDGAVAAAENVRRAIAGVTIGGIDRPITASLGIAVYPNDAGDPASLIRQADRALYLAKSRGRDRVEVADNTVPAPADAVPNGHAPVAAEVTGGS